MLRCSAVGASSSIGLVLVWALLAACATPEAARGATASAPPRTQAAGPAKFEAYWHGKCGAEARVGACPAGPDGNVIIAEPPEVAERGESFTPSAQICPWIDSLESVVDAMPVDPLSLALHHLEPIRPRPGAVTACYEAALKSRKDLGGLLQVEVLIAPDGRVDAVRALRDGVGSPELACCINTAIATWSFPHEYAGRVVLRLPIRLRSVPPSEGYPTTRANRP